MSNICLDINIPKKRGRKPKIKCEKELLDEKIPKKRGRKPKNKIVDEVKQPKKRGRKPNMLNTKTPVINISNDKLIKSDNILHLKINTKDLDEYILGDDIYKYNPNINEPIPYENTDTLSGNLNYGSLNTKTQIVDNKKDNIIDNKIDNTIIYKENIQEDNIPEYVSDVNVENSENYTTCNKKKKNIRPIMYYYNESNKRKKWPLKSNIKCLWCCHHFDNYPCALPIKLKSNTFYVFGNFCSKECACAYNFDSNINSSVIWERYVLLNHLYSIIENNPDLKINQAPPRLTLIDFGGYLSIKEFRNSDENNKYNILFPPMVSIIPSVEENYKDKLKQKDSYYIPIDKERIVKVNNDLRLKRKKPITNKNTLENCMMLKYN